MAGWSALDYGLTGTMTVTMRLSNVVSKMREFLSSVTKVTAAFYKLKGPLPKQLCSLEPSGDEGP